jgi:hypothetical protein
MILAQENFDDINEASLQALIDNGIPEGPLLEYKRQVYGRSDKDKREFLKDATGFVNASGGHLIIGMDEADSVASALVPIVGADLDEEIRRMEQMLLDNVEPRIIGIKIRAVSITGGACIVLRIPASWNPPHRVTQNDINRFFYRHSKLTDEAGVDELRVLFNRGATAQELALSFRRERLAHILAGETPEPIQLRPVTVALHIIPLLGPRVARIPDINREIGHIKEWQPLRTPTGSNWRYNFEGLVTYDGTQLRLSYLQLFRNGAIEAVQSGLGMDNQLPAGATEGLVLNALLRLLTALHRVDIPPPVAVIVTLIRTQGVRLMAEAHNPSRAFDRDVFQLPPVIINELGNDGDYDALMRPIFDAMWQAAGDYRSANFDANDRWLGRRR